MKFTRFAWLLLIPAAWTAAMSSAGLERVPIRGGLRFTGLVDTAFYPVSLNQPDAAFLKTGLARLRREVYIDYAKRTVEMVEYYADSLEPFAATQEDTAASGVVLSRYVFLEMNEYLAFVNKGADNAEWKAGNPFFSLAEKQRKSFNPLDIEIPVKLPAWARRVVGSEGPRLTISGMFKITLGGSSHWETGGENIQNQRQGWPDLVVGQEMNFTVTGKIGRLINVSISTDNTADITDQLKKQMKIHYKGETEDELEDEVVQEIEAGYTSFSMPGSEFDGYSESHEGLFGIKVRMKLGDLNITTILSQEDGQADKKTFDPKQSSRPETFTERDIAYDKVFFLDETFRQAFYSGAGTSRKVKKVYLLRYDPQLSLNTFDANRSVYPNHRNVGAGLHEILREYGGIEGGQDFYVDNINGFVVLSESKRLMYRGDQLLAYFILEDGTTSADLGYKYAYNDTAKGDTVSIDGVSIRPYVLRPRDINANDPKWLLMRKDVYNIGTIAEQNRDEIKITLRYKNPSTNNQFYETVNNGGAEIPLIDFFGLTKDRVLDTKNKDIFNFDFGILAFPKKFQGKPFDNDSLPAAFVRNTEIYNLLPDEQTNKQVGDNFQIEKIAKSTQTSFSLEAMNIIEGSEKVRIGATVLQRDLDYQILYDIGQLTLISERAIQSMDQVTVEFEWAPFFVPEEKTFMGLRAEYALPGIGANSKVAASFLRKSETSQDKRAQLGREPSTNMLVDVNAVLNWEPEWMTDLANKVPGVRTDQKSRLSVQAEYARSIVNPNTNDRSEALVDDFEDSKTLYTLQLSDQLWKWASPPFDSVLGFSSGPDSTSYAALQCWGGNGRDQGELLDAGWFAWFTHDTLEDDIWPGSTNRQARWRTLALRMKPHGRKDGDANASREGTALSWFKKASWGGVMAPLGYGVQSQLDNAQYIDLWLRVDGSKGILHLDLGELSEDVRIAAQNPQDPDTNSLFITNAAPDGRYNNEWFMGRRYMATINDLGIDMRADPSEALLLPKAASTPGVILFDTIRHSASVPDPAGDNFDWTVQSSDFRAYNGTQGNSSGKNYDIRKENDPDDEDVFNSNGIVDRKNAYYHYWIDLSQDTSLNEPYLVAVNKNNWRHYIIPISHPKVTGNPSLDSIPFVVGNPLLRDAKGIRLWMNNLTGTSVVEIAKVEIVGNKWIARDTLARAAGAVTDSSERAILNVSVVNTVDDRDNYGDRNGKPPAFVPYFIDRDRNVTEREQSLKLTYDSLTRASGEIYAVKYSQRGLDFRLYEKLRFFYLVFSRAASSTPTLPDASSAVRFFFRFGTDSTNYYEYFMTLPAPDAYRWDSVTVSLAEISRLKQYEDAAHFATDNAHMSVRGNPTIADVKWLTLGFRVDPASGSDESYKGVLFVNDLKLTEPQKLGGNASRVKLETAFADLLTFNTGAYYKDGSFLRLTDKREGGGQSEMSLDVSGNLTLNKLTPAAWGLSIPVGYSVNSVVRRPRYIPGSDVRLSDDGLSEMAPALVRSVAGSAGQGLPDSASERYESRSLSRSINASFGKTTQSDRLITNLFLDRIKTTGGVQLSDNKEVTKQDRTMSVNNEMSYNANARTDRVFQPLRNTEKPFLKDHFSDFKFNWYPKSLDLKLYNARYSTTEEKSRPSVFREPVPLPNKYSLTMTHSYDLNWNPLIEGKHLTFGLSQNNSVDRNFTDAVTRRGGFSSGILRDEVFGVNDRWLLEDGLLPREFMLKGETKNSQTFNFNLEPSLFRWLTHSATYNSNYGLMLNTAPLKSGTNQEYLDLTRNASFNTNLNWAFTDMFDWLNTDLLKNRGDPVFKPIKSFFDYLSFNRLGLNYDVKVDHRVSNLKRMPLTPSQYLLYRSGFHGLSPLDIVRGTEDPEIFGGWKYAHDDATFVTERGVSNTDERSVSRNAGTNLGVTLPFLLRTSFSGDLGWSQTYAERPGRITVDTNVTWPRLRVSANLPDFMPIIKRLPGGDGVNSASTGTGLEYERGYDHKYNEVNEALSWFEKRYKWAMNPLFKLSLDLKNKVRLANDIAWSLERKFSTDRTAPSKGLEDYTFSDKASINYALDKHKTVKVLFWDLTFNNQLNLFANYDYSMTWSYEWDVYVADKKYESYDEWMKALQADKVHKQKKKNVAVRTGANYDITAKMKAGGEVGWSRDLEVKPGTEDDHTDNHPKYNIDVKTWVQWNF